MRQSSEGYMSVGKWVATFFITSIPIVGVIYSIGWLLGKSRYQERVNYMRAMLVWAIIITVLAAIASVLILYVFNMTFDQVLSDFSNAIQTEATAA